MPIHHGVGVGTLGTPSRRPDTVSTVRPTRTIRPVAHPPRFFSPPVSGGPLAPTMGNNPWDEGRGDFPGGGQPRDPQDEESEADEGDENGSTITDPVSDTFAEAWRQLEKDGLGPLGPPGWGGGGGGGGSTPPDPPVFDGPSRRELPGGALPPWVGHRPGAPDRSPPRGDEAQPWNPGEIIRCTQCRIAKSNYQRSLRAMKWYCDQCRWCAYGDCLRMCGIRISALYLIAKAAHAKCCQELDHSCRDADCGPPPTMCEW